MDSFSQYYNQVSCIDRQIAELEARKDASIHGYCYIGVTYINPLVDEKKIGNSSMENEPAISPALVFSSQEG